MNHFLIARRKLLKDFAAASSLALLGTGAFANEYFKSIRIGEGTVPDYTHFYVADTRGMWKQNGLSATSTMFPAGRLAVDALIAGQVDIATSAETPVMLAALNGLPIRVFATVVTYQPFDLVTGPAIKSLDDLAGKKIGYVQGTNAHFYLDKLLAKHGLTQSNISAINMPVGNFVPSLLSDAIDGFVWSEPLISAALSQGPKYQRLHSDRLYFAYGCVSALETTIETMPDLLVRAVKTMMDADGFVKSDAAQAQKILSDTLKLDPSGPAKFWSGMDFRIVLDSNRLVGDLKSQAQWALDNGLAKPGSKMPDFSTIVTDKIYKLAQSA